MNPTNSRERSYCLVRSVPKAQMTGPCSWANVTTCARNLDARTCHSPLPTLSGSLGALRIRPSTLTAPCPQRLGPSLREAPTTNWNAAYPEARCPAKNLSQRNKRVFSSKKPRNSNITYSKSLHYRYLPHSHISIVCKYLHYIFAYGETALPRDAVLHRDCGNSYTTMCTCQNSKNHRYQRVNVTLCKFKKLHLKS